MTKPFSTRVTLYRREGDGFVGKVISNCMWSEERSLFEKDGAFSSPVKVRVHILKREAGDGLELCEGDIIYRGEGQNAFSESERIMFLTQNREKCFTAKAIKRNIFGRGTDHYLVKS